MQSAPWVSVPIGLVTSKRFGILSSNEEGMSVAPKQNDEVDTRAVPIAMRSMPICCETRLAYWIFACVAEGEAALFAKSVASTSTPHK